MHSGFQQRRAPLSPAGTAGSTELPARRIQDHRGRAALKARGGPRGSGGCRSPTERRGHKRSAQEAKLQGWHRAAMHFGEMLPSRLRGARAGSGTKPQARGSGGTAGCCASFLPAQLRARLQASTEQPESLLFLCSEPKRVEFTPKFGCFLQSFYSNCEIITIGFLRA